MRDIEENMLRILNDMQRRSKLQNNKKDKFQQASTAVEQGKII